MDVAVLSVPTEVSIAKREEYREWCEAHPDDIEALNILKAFELLAVGTKLLPLDRAFRAVSVDVQHRPRLAIARADRRQVCVAVYHGSFVFDADFGVRVGRRAKDCRITVASPAAHYSPQPGYALVPLIPPDIRPAPSTMKERFVLWDVEQWADSPHSVEADRDPLLLKRVTPNLYAVLAEWDLTDAERFAMGQRLVEG